MTEMLCEERKLVVIGTQKKLNQTRRISDVIYVKKMFVGHPYL